MNKRKLKLSFFYVYQGGLLLGFLIKYKRVNE